MRGGKIGVVAIVFIAGIASPGISWGREVEPEVGRYRAHVATLASKAFGGRSGPDAARAADYVEAEFRRLGLEPAFDGKFAQEIRLVEGHAVIGRNMGAKIVGSDPKLRDEWIVVGAHFDHVGRRGSVYFPGADDNATGTAMMLETARCFAQSAERPRRSVLFLGFDLEEQGLVGSRFFVEHPIIPPSQIKLFVTADMIGRALAGVCDEFVFLFGADTMPGMRGWLSEAGRDEPLRLGMLGNDVMVVDRSDYGPFRHAKIPYLFFSTGENPLYHHWQDRSDTIDYAKAIATTRIVRRVLARASDADALPGWDSKPEPTLDEAIVVRDVFRILEAHREALKIGPIPLSVLRTTLKTLDGIVARGTITPGERSGIIRAAQYLMITVL